MIKRPFELQHNKTALIIIDMQNDFVRAGAPLEVPDAKYTIEPISKLIKVSRAKGIPVIYTKFVAGPKHTLMWEWSPQIEQDKCCFKGFMRSYSDSSEPMECTDIIKELYPEKGDYVIEKYGYSAFHNTNLTGILHAENRDSLIVTGTVTQICVADTVHAAFHENLKATVVLECVSSLDRHLHDAALKNISMKYGMVERIQDVIKKL